MKSDYKVRAQKFVVDFFPYIENAINFLLNKKVIFIEDDNILYKDLEN